MRCLMLWNHWGSAAQIGCETISCLQIEHLDEVDLEALALALNRLGETGSWNIEILGERMIALENAGIEIASTGFTAYEGDENNAWSVCTT